MEVDKKIETSSKLEATKKVRNKSGHRVELVINDKVVVFLPRQTVEVPADFDVPQGLGLFVR